MTKRSLARSKRLPAAERVEERRDTLSKRHMADITTDQKRIYELAKDYKISSPAMMKILSGAGFCAEVAHVRSIARDDLRGRREVRAGASDRQERDGGEDAGERSARKSGSRGCRRTKQSSSRACIMRHARLQAVTADANQRHTAAAVPPVPGAAVAIGGIKVSDGSTPVAGLMRKIEKKKKKKERRRKKDRRDVDQVEVAKAFKSTMANLSGARTKKRYHRGRRMTRSNQKPMTAMSSKSTSTCRWPNWPSCWTTNRPK